MGLFFLTKEIRNLIESITVATKLRKQKHYISYNCINWNNIKEYSREQDGRDIIKIDRYIQIDIYKDRVILHLPTNYYNLKALEKIINEKPCAITDSFKPYDSLLVLTLPLYKEDLTINDISEILLTYTF